jgi:hypothetical protein
MIKEKLKGDLESLGRLLIDNSDQGNESLTKEVMAKKEVVTNFLQLSKEEREDFLSFIQSSTIAVEKDSSNAPNYPLKNILIISMIDSSNDVISVEEQREYLNLLLDAEEIDQELIVGLNTPLERAILRGDLPKIRFLIEEKKAQPAYVFDFLCSLIQVNFSVLYSQQEDAKKATTNSECYNYILKQIILLDIEVEEAATIVIQLSNIIKEAIKTKEDRESKETAEKLIEDLRQSQGYIESQLYDDSIERAKEAKEASFFLGWNLQFERSQDNRYNRDMVKEVEEIRKAIRKILKLNDDLLYLSSKVNLSIALRDVDRFRECVKRFLGDQNKLLRSACRAGSVEITKYLVEEEGVDLNCVNKYGHTALIAACESGNVELVRYLVETKGADISSTDLFRDTPLNIACRDKNVEIIQVLLKTGKVTIEVLRVLKSDPAIEALLTQCLTHDTSSIKMEDTELNQNFTSNLVLRAGPSLAALHR